MVIFLCKMCAVDQQMLGDTALDIAGGDFLSVSTALMDCK